MKKIIVAILIMFSFIVLSTEFKTDPRLVSGTLPNGLQYYILQNKKPEKKAILNLIVKTGSIQEEDGDEGIAHVLEHMSFNGTKKYKKNDMIKYLQSIGLTFGGDLNAYTSFDETLYMLVLPTDDKVKYEKGIEILKEWANEVVISKTELESEKKIILEEWRLRQGLSQRLGDIRKKALLDNTRYYDRFPIGTVESIKNTTSERIKKFYDKWYHPKNMAVIAIGDLDIAQTENLIKKYFNYTPRSEYVKPDEYSINKTKNKYVTFTDPEITTTIFYITKIVDREIIKTKEAYKRSNIQLLLFNIINTRISNLTIEKDTPLLDANIHSSSFNITHDMISLGTAIKDNSTKEGIELTYNIFKSTFEKGISQLELDLEKKNTINSFKNLLVNKDSITHARIAEEISRHYLTGESYIGIEEEFKVFSENMETITVEDLNNYFNELYKEESLYFITGSSKNESLPDDKALQTIIEEASKSDKTLDFDTTEVILPPIPIKDGEIISSDGGIYKLSNGIDVAIKKTDFDKDKILIRLFKKEGSSNLSYNKFLNSIFAPTIIINSGVSNLTPKDLESFMKGKNFYLTPFISDYEQGIEIVCDEDGLIPALEYMNYLVREPKVDDVIFKNTMEEITESINNRGNSPGVIYHDEIVKIYSNSNERRLPLTLEEVKKINEEEILSTFKEKFDNFNGFKLIILGSYDESKIEGILKKYFASLPSNEHIENEKDLKIDVPKGIETKTLVKGVDKKATVTLIFPYNHIYGENERVLYAAFSKVLETRLIDEIREKMGGVYSISSHPSLSPNNYGENKLIIQFSCDTKRVNEIKKATLNVLKQMTTRKVPNERLLSLSNNYALSYRNDILQNAYWINYYYQKFTVGESFKIPTPKEYKTIITGNKLLDFSKKAINMNNYIDVTLLPEKEE
jgi:zinc protease